MAEKGKKISIQTSPLASQANGFFILCPSPQLVGTDGSGRFFNQKYSTGKIGGQYEKLN